MSHAQRLVIDIGQGLSLMVGMPTISNWTTKDRPKDPSEGTFGFNTETNHLEYWDGQNWMAASMKA